MRSSLSQRIGSLSLAVAAVGICLALTPSVASAVDDTTPPTVVVSDQGVGSLSPFMVDFSEPVAIPDASAVQFVESEDAVNLRGALDCASGFVAVSYCKTWAFTPSESTILHDIYDVYFTAAPGTFADQAGNEMAQAFVSARATTELGTSDPSMRYRWSSRPDSGAIGGSISRERENGATFSYTFKGRSVVWYTVLGPNQGSADVEITRPGREPLRRSVNNTSATVTKQWPITFTKLGVGYHTITVTVTGDPTNHEAKTKFVTVDALKTGNTTVGDASLDYSWHSFDDAVWTYQPNARRTFQFRGSAVVLGIARKPDGGRVRILVDGQSWGIVDLYNASFEYNFVIVDGLSDAKHTVTAVTLPTNNVSSTGHAVGLRYAAIGTCTIC